MNLSLNYKGQTVKKVIASDRNRLRIPIFKSNKTQRNENGLNSLWKANLESAFKTKRQMICCFDHRRIRVLLRIEMIALIFQV